MYDSYLARSCMHAQDACRLVWEIGFKLGDVSKEGVPLYTFFLSNQSMTHFITVSVLWKPASFNKRLRGGTRIAFLKIKKMGG